MSHIVTSFLTVVVALFPIVNPLGMIPIFLRLTEGSSLELRASLAMRIATGGLALMLASLFVGSYILAFFGLTVPAVQVAGGLVVIATGWRLLNQGEDARTRETHARVPEEVIVNRAFFPLTMPLTVGPGTISVAITLGARGAGSGQLFTDAVGAVLGSIAVAASIYVSYRFAGRVSLMLGEGGSDVVLRLSAFILLCLGVQILWNGYGALVSLGPQ